MFYPASVSTAASVVVSGSPSPCRLIGAFGAYVDGFPCVESDGPEWEGLMNIIKGLYARGKREHYDVHPARCPL
eukprot:11186754-Lingulodinium_polyedra.AAC.1